MAGTLLHVTLAARALARADLPAAAAAEARAADGDFRLGAVLLDLPYFERLWLTGLHLLLGADLSFGGFGNLLHVRSPLGLSLRLLERARHRPGSPAARALALGSLTHLAVDAVFHPEINRRVMTLADGSRSLDTEHKRLEDEMDLHIHYDLLEHPGMGTPYARRMLWLKPSPGWTTDAEAAVAAVHGAAPGSDRLEGWRRELSMFGLLCSNRLAPWISTLPADDPALAEAACRLADEAIRLSAAYLELGAAYLEGDIGEARLREAIPDVNLLTGGPAEPPRPPCSDHLHR